MAAVRPGDSIGCTNPSLDIFLQIRSVMTDVASLEFIIFDISTPDRESDPVQVYPPTGRHAVNLAACPVGERIATGHYCAKWIVSGTEPLGKHLIQWFYKHTLLSTERTFEEEFEVLTSTIVTSSDDYAAVSDFRDEGITTEQASDSRLLGLITTSSRFIDKMTRRFFNPRPLEYWLDGNGHEQIFLEHPIIALEEIEVSWTGSSGSNDIVNLSDVVIYNRHLRGLLTPDDRDNPRIGFKTVDPDFLRLHALFGRRLFYQGRQNIRIKGVFGYTDPNGTGLGKTPDLIKKACRLLVVRDLPTLGDPDGREDAVYWGRKKRERTRDQEVEYQPRADTVFTGDPEIDNILGLYMKPLEMGAA